MPQLAEYQPVEHPAQQAARLPALRPPQRPSGPPPSFANRMMWLVILWCVGFGGTFLAVLPFHLLVKWAMHQ
jgi:hypothetical protein